MSETNQLDELKQEIEILKKNQKKLEDRLEFESSMRRSADELDRKEKFQQAEKDYQNLYDQHSRIMYHSDTPSWEKDKFEKMYIDAYERVNRYKDCGDGN